MDRFLSWNQLKPRVPYSRQHVGRLEARDQFPKRRWLSPNRVAWLESEVDAWLASRERGGPPQKADLGPKSRPPLEPDAGALETLRALAARLGHDVVPRKPERRRSGSPP